MSKKKQYIIYDGRAIYNEDAASVLCCAETLKEAKNDCKMYGEACVFEYDRKGKTLTNGVMVYHYLP